jgi:hypothetical protein
LLCSLIAFSLVACDGSGGDDPPDDGFSDEPSSTVPAGGEQPLLLYRELVDTRTTPGRSTPIWRIVLYDLALQQELSSFEVGRTEPDVPSRATLGGDSVAVNLERRVVVYTPDGHERAELHRVEGEGQYIIDAAISPDGSKVALTVQVSALCPEPTPGAAGQCRPYAEVTQILAFDVESGAEVLRVRQNVPAFEGFIGQAALITWHADSGGFAVSGYTHSEAPGGTATVLLDGTVTTHFSTGYPTEIAPGGAYAARSQPEYCDLAAAPVRPEFQIIELASGAEVNIAQHDGLNVAPYEWSPGGSELLYYAYALAPDTSPGSTPESCPDEDPASRRWYVLPADGTAAQAVADPVDARRNWYGDRLLEYTCNGEPTIEAHCITGNETASFDVLNAGDVITTAKDFAVIGYPGWTPSR